MPADYMIYIGADVYFNTNQDHYPAVPIPHSKALVIEKDPYERATMAYPQRIYIKEVSDGLQIITGDAAAVSGVILEYLQIPTKVNFGTEISLVGSCAEDSPWATLTGTPKLIDDLTAAATLRVYCDTECVFQSSTSGPITGRVVHPAGTIIAEMPKFWKLVSGTITYGYVECSFPESLFDEVARVSSAILSGTISNLAGKQDLMNQPKQ
jgi:hypothetical protein